MEGIVFLHLHSKCSYFLFLNFLRLTSTSGAITEGPGNYTTNMSCTWLIDSGTTGMPIHLRFEHLATECGWDHLYVYDGDSAFAPILGAFRYVHYAILAEPRTTVFFQIRTIAISVLFVVGP